MANTRPLACRVHQHGVAIITALVVVAVVATLAAALGLEQELWLRQTQNLVDRAQAEATRRAAIEWSALILREDARDNATDDLSQAWAQALPPLPAEGGLVAGKIRDAQGSFNLNNVLRQGKPSTEDIALLQRLLESQGLPAGLADAVVDWMDADNAPRPGSAEDVDYLSTEKPYRAANQALQSVGELRLIRGFDAAALERLRPYITVLPEETAININTAPAPVLAAMMPELARVELERLIAEREERPFAKASDLAARLPTDAAPPKVPYDVKSAYFEVTVDTRYGQLQRRALALLHRQSADVITPLWQAQQLLLAPASEKGG